MVRKYPTEVTSFTNPAENIYTVELRSLAGRFRYLPGQFLHIALDEYDPSGGWPESRCFSIRTPAGRDTLKITFATKGAFTMRMKNELSPGKMVTVKLPYGQLFQHDLPKTGTVFIAGGTGITPFLSLFLDIAFKEYSGPKVYLGFRNEYLNIYRNELEQALNINPSAVIDTFYEDRDGILDIQKIFANNCKDTVYYLSGPQPMITGFRSFLSMNGVPANRIISDDWE